MLEDKLVHFGGEPKTQVYELPGQQLREQAEEPLVTATIHSADVLHVTQEANLPADNEHIDAARQGLEFSMFN